MVEFPKRIYRYKSLDGQSLLHTLDIIQNSRLFAPLASQLNDPCEGFYKWMDEDFPEFNESEKLRNPRILSFSDRYNITALWAHYSSGFRGICLEFDCDKLRSNIVEFRAFDQVKDTKSVPRITVRGSKYIDRFFYKSLDWEHEREWRIVTSEDYDFLNFDRDTLTRVFIGPRTDKNVEKMLLTILKDQKFVPKIQKVSFSNVSYKMIFKT